MDDFTILLLGLCGLLAVLCLGAVLARANDWDKEDHRITPWGEWK